MLVADLVVMLTNDPDLVDKLTDDQLDEVGKFVGLDLEADARYILAIVNGDGDAYAKATCNAPADGAEVVAPTRTPAAAAGTVVEPTGQEAMIDVMVKPLAGGWRFLVGRDLAKLAKSSRLRRYTASQKRHGNRSGLNLLNVNMTTSKQKSLADRVLSTARIRKMGGRTLTAEEKTRQDCLMAELAEIYTGPKPKIGTKGVTYRGD